MMFRPLKCWCILNPNARSNTAIMNNVNVQIIAHFTQGFSSFRWYLIRSADPHIKDMSTANMTNVSFLTLTVSPGLF